jgi:hypothetical protein
MTDSQSSLRQVLYLLSYVTMLRDVENRELEARVTLDPIVGKST